jgi:hypothetical protein
MANLTGIEKDGSKRKQIRLKAACANLLFLSRQLALKRDGGSSGA